MTEREYKVGKHHCYFQDFSGINEFADFIRENPNRKEWFDIWEGKVLKKLEQDEYERNDVRFRGVHGYAEAQDKLLNGVNVREIHRARAASFTAERRMVARGVAGGVPIVPATLASCPMNMLTLRPQPERRSLRVFVDCAMPCRVSGSDMSEAGKKVVAVLAKLDAVANYDLVAGSVTCDSHATENVYGLGINIKTSGKPFSASRVSFCLTSPAFLRVFEFLWDGKNKNIKPMDGFGRSLSGYDGESFKKLMKMHHKDTIVISLEKVVDYGESYITKTFKEAGITL